jgi:Uma2 family endonuclease
MSAIPQPRVTPEEYLARERAAESKHEYYQSEIFAMGGASPRHNLITLNAGGELRQRLRDRPCLVYTSDQRVKVNQAGLYTYPDITVVCSTPEYDDEQQDTLLNPRVLFEVLSASTADYDRGGKFTLYRQLPSLQEYVLISHDRVLVEHYVRDGDRWIFSELNSPADTLILSSLECKLPLAEIYLKVDFDEQKST